MSIFLVAARVNGVSSAPRLSMKNVSMRLLPSHVSPLRYVRTSWNWWRMAQFSTSSSIFCFDSMP